MRANSKPGTVLVMYTIILYSFWSLLELYLKTKIGIDEFTKEVYIKCVVWLVPAILIHFNFSDDMFIKKEEMYLLNKKCWIAVPMMLLLAIYIIINEYLVNGKLEINESFGINTVVEVLSIAAGEEMVFRGLFLSAILRDKKKYLSVFINSLLFLAIHFPVWIQSGTFISAFTSGGFITVLLLSCIFSFAFIKTKSIWTAVFLHFGWDFLLFIF
ncbi:type II CAAX endopeptidase family protein [Candidatus Merdisoma sp. JLR.KK006]|uniref:CPBP family intramembrane glutamic endopeptidase n=1 Tax=Candidatus Merdisoma sp. JLR.KK006 TaxID=3112626 RepID=UPI002FEE7CB2